MVVLGEAVGFVADVLEEFADGIVGGEADFFVMAVEIENFFFFGDGHQAGHGGIHFPEGFFGGVELAETAVDEDDIGPEFLPRHCPLVAAGDDFFEAGVVVDAGDGFDLKASVAVFEGLAVDELDHRADGFRAGQMGDVKAFDDADGLVGLEQGLQFGQGLGGIGGEGFRLDVFIDGAAFVEIFDQADSVAALGGGLEIQPGGGVGHLGIELLEYRGTFGLHKRDKVANLAAVVVLGDLVAAGGGTLADVVQDTGAEETAFVIVLRISSVQVRNL